MSNDYNTQKSRVRGYEIAYTAMTLDGDSVLLYPTMTVKDLIIGDDLIDSLPFVVQTAVNDDGNGSIHLFTFEHLHSDPYDETPWIVSYNLEVTEVLAYNHPQGIDQPS